MGILRLFGVFCSIHFKVRNPFSLSVGIRTPKTAATYLLFLFPSTAIIVTHSRGHSKYGKEGGHQRTTSGRLVFPTYGNTV